MMQQVMGLFSRVHCIFLEPNVEPNAEPNVERKLDGGVFSYPDLAQGEKFDADHGWGGTCAKGESQSPIDFAETSIGRS